MGYYFKEKRKISIGKDVEKLKSSSITADNVYCSQLGKQCDKSSKGQSFTTHSSNSITRYIPKKIENRFSNKNLYMNVHSSTLYNS